MADTSLRARLSRLFATNVVVRRISKNRLKAIDTNRLQSTGNLSNKKYVDRFSGVQRGTPGYGTYNQNQTFHTSKVELFTDYEAMDMDPILASALDIYADESTVKDADGDVVAAAGRIIAPALTIPEAVVGTGFEYIKAETDDLGMYEPQLEKFLPSIPGVGPLIYNWFGGGAEKYNERWFRESLK